MLPIGDTTMEVIEYALDGLALRSEVTAANFANAEVPGFRASRVSFEAELERALGSGDVGAAAAPGRRLAATAPDQHGNTVDVEQELVEMIKTNLVQQAMVDAFNFKAGMLRTAIGSR